MAVEVLATTAVDPYLDARRSVFEHDGAVRLVSMLAALSRPPGEGLLEITVIDADLVLSRFGQNGDRDSAGVNAAAFFGGWHTLKPVATGLASKRLRRLLADDTKQQKSGPRL